MPEPLVTIVVSARERHSPALRCLPALVARTRLPYRLIYVGGDVPAYAREFLETVCRRHGFDLELRPHPLSANEARNIALGVTTTRYVFLGPEQGVDAGPEVELRFALPEVREAGYLVLRGWSTRAVRPQVREVTLHADDR